MRSVILKAVCRILAWILLLAILALSIGPASTRPITGAPQSLEHFGIFFPTGVALAIGYPLNERFLFVGLTIYCALIEVAQMFVPTRHARWSDFAVDASAACLGVAVVLIAKKVKPALRP